MTRLTAAVLFGGLVGGAPREAAGQVPPTVLDELVGAWRGEGTLLGREATFSMRWVASDVPGVFALDFTNAFRAADGKETPVLGAQGLYRVHPDGTVEGTWFDTRGVRVELRGVADTERLRVEWRAPTESGVTVYARTGDGGFEVADSVRVPDGLRPFGRARYRPADRARR